MGLMRCWGYIVQQVFFKDCTGIPVRLLQELSGDN